MVQLKDKVFIITGGVASIGYEISKKMIDLGARVVIADIADDMGKAAQERLGEHAFFVHTDITKDEDCENLIQQCVNRFGKIDVLVNNAASYGDDGAKTTRETWLHTLNVNAVAAAILGEMARPYLKASKGCIVNTGSISGAFPHIERWAYPVSKATLIHLNKTQAVEYAADGIRVNMVRLGHVWSAPFEGLTQNDRAHADKVTKAYNLIGRVANGEEIANAVAFVASDDASYMTGSEIVVDGGYSAMGPEQHYPLMSKLMKNQ
ncbi:SDR family oxidoreductase [Soonwooa purpurea]